MSRITLHTKPKVKECEICTGTSTSTKTLPCKHSMCEPCQQNLTESIVISKLTCPLCKKITGDSVQMKCSGKLGCDNCLELKDTSEFWWCNACSAVFCSRCTLKDHKFPDHKLVEWDSLGPIDVLQNFLLKSLAEGKKKEESKVGEKSKENESKKQENKVEEKNGEHDSKKEENKVCANCEMEITAGRYLTASGKLYHADCFKCHTCHKVITGASHMVDEKKRIYCVDCYYDKFAPICASCDKKILPKKGERGAEWVSAIGKDYHPDCYKCEDCGLMLDSGTEGHECIPLNDHLYCQPCYAKREK